MHYILAQKGGTWNRHGQSKLLESNYLSLQKGNNFIATFSIYFWFAVSVYQK